MVPTGTQSEPTTLLRDNPSRPHEFPVHVVRPSAVICHGRLTAHRPTRAVPWGPDPTGLPDTRQ